MGIIGYEGKINKLPRLSRDQITDQTSFMELGASQRLLASKVPETVTSKIKSTVLGLDS